MKLSPLLKFAVLAGALAAVSACRSDPLGPTGVQVDILTEDSRFFATSFVLVWMDEANQLFQVRVPEQGFIDEEHAPAVSVFIAQPDRVGVRRVLVRGYRDEATPVSEGAARLVTVRHVWSQLGLKMFPIGSLPDQDTDGLPDTVDNCPKERDPCGSSPPVEGDGGADVDGGSHAAAPDLDAGAEVSFDPTGVPDAGPSQR